MTSGRPGSIPSTTRPYGILTIFYSVAPWTTAASASVMAVPKSSRSGRSDQSDQESDRQVHGNGCEGFGEVIDQRPEEDAKCLRFTRLRIRGLYRNKLR